MMYATSIQVTDKRSILAVPHAKIN